MSAILRLFPGRLSWMAMKVGGPRQVETQTLRRAGPREAARGAFALDQPGAERPVAHAAPASPLSAVDALIALQGVAETGEGRRRAIRRGGEMLDLLDDIRLGLLDGQVPRGKLEGLLRVVQSGRDAIADPHLARVLDDIELRARVELAKFGTAA